MNVGLIIPISLILGLLTWSLIAKWYVMPRLVLLQRKEALQPLLLLHSLRYVGLSFLVPGVVSSTMPTAFSHPAAYGDLLATILALVALAALHIEWRIAIPTVWIFNIEGSLDLLYAIAQGAQFKTGDFGSTLFIPTMIVPALLVSHMMIFRILVQKKGQV